MLLLLNLELKTPGFQKEGSTEVSQSKGYLCFHIVVTQWKPGAPLSLMYFAARGFLFPCLHHPTVKTSVLLLLSSVIKKQVFVTRFTWPALLNPSLGRPAKLNEGEGKLLKAKYSDYRKKWNHCSSKPSRIGGGSNYISVSLWKKGS